jgi:hypothetical protein
MVGDGAGLVLPDDDVFQKAVLAQLINSSHIEGSLNTASNDSMGSFLRSKKQADEVLEQLFLNLLQG